MCPNVTELQYIEGTSRYDRETFDLLKTLISTGDIRGHKLNTITDTWVNICYFNKTRNKVNEKCAERFIKERQLEAFKIGLHNVCEGMPVICQTNLKQQNMYNSQMFKVPYIDEKEKNNRCR